MFKCKYLKTLIYLKKFLFINFVFYNYWTIYIHIFKNIQPSLIKKKSQNHINIINNTIDNINKIRCKIPI